MKAVKALGRTLLLSRMYLVLIAFSLLGLHFNSLSVQQVSFTDEAGVTQVKPAPYTISSRELHTVSIVLNYNGYENPYLRISPYYRCISGEITLNEVVHQSIPAQNFLCGDVLLDLSERLIKGKNVLSFDLINRGNIKYHYSIGVSVGSPLFGYDILQSLLTLMFAGSVLMLIVAYFERISVPIGLTLIYVAAYILGLQFFCRLPHYGFGLDLNKHMFYIQHISEHFFSPYTYNGAEGWHPPLYYYLVSLLARFAEFFGTFDPWTAVRAVSLVCHCFVLYFSMRTLQLFLKGMELYLAFALFAFWPAFMFVSAWVYNDALLYPFCVAAFYYTLRWYKLDEENSFVKALSFSALAIVTKTSGVVALGVLGTIAAFKLFTGQVSLRSFFTRPVLTGYALLLVGVLVNLGKHLYKAIMNNQGIGVGYLGGGGSYKPMLENFSLLGLSNILEKPYFFTWEDPSLIGLHLRTMLFTNAGGGAWKDSDLGRALMLCMLIMLLVNFAFIIMQRMRHLRASFPVIVGWLVPVVAVVVFTLLCHMGSCMDFRYVRFALLAVVILYALSLVSLREAGHRLLYWSANSLAGAFIVLSLVISQLGF